MSTAPLSVNEQLSLIEDLDGRQNELLEQLDALNQQIEQVLKEVQLLVVGSEVGVPAEA